MTPEEYKIQLQHEAQAAQRALSLLAQFEAAQRSIQALEARVKQLEGTAAKASGSD